ncbi:MAG: PIG-L family deacetylase [Lentisphaerae bacterium]|nr:PIG-L family deacetylase [Lentisphaerota bacterium]
MNHLVVFSPHHDDAYWQTSGISIFLKRQGWKVTYITVIGDHYQWGGGKKEYRKRAVEAARQAGVEHVLLDYKSMASTGTNAQMGEEFCKLIKELKPTIAVTEYPVSTHPDHNAVGINSLRALTKSWFGEKRQLPDEVWCYQGYNPNPIFDFSVDISSVKDEVKKRMCYWHEFGRDEKNSLWKTRRDNGLREKFFIAKANPKCLTIAPELFKDKFEYMDFRIPSNLIF